MRFVIIGFVQEWEGTRIIPVCIAREYYQSCQVVASQLGKTPKIC